MTFHIIFIISVVNILLLGGCRSLNKTDNSNSILERQSDSFDLSDPYETKKEFENWKKLIDLSHSLARKEFKKGKEFKNEFLKMTEFANQWKLVKIAHGSFGDKSDTRADSVWIDGYGYLISNEQRKISILIEVADWKFFGSTDANIVTRLHLYADGELPKIEEWLYDGYYILGIGKRNETRGLWQATYKSDGALTDALFYHHFLPPPPFGSKEIAQLKFLESISIESNPKLTIIKPPVLAFEKFFRHESEFRLRKIWPDLTLAKMREISGNGNRIKVGLVDSGVDYNHPALSYKIFRNENEELVMKDFGTNDNLPFDSSFDDSSVSYQTHGTHVAGRMMRDIDEVALLVAKHKYLESPAQPIEFLAKNGVSIVNMSLGAVNGEVCEEWKNSISKYNQILFIVAAGNSGMKLTKYSNYCVSKLSGMDNVIVVGSIDSNSASLSTFSNFGSNIVDIAAIGNKVQSLDVNFATSIKSGTSMAAPRVTNFAIKQKLSNQNANASQLKQMILQSAKISEKLSNSIDRGRYIED